MINITAIKSHFNNIGRKYYTFCYMHIKQSSETFKTFTKAKEI